MKKKKRPILKLNRSWFPIATCEWQDVITDIFSGAVNPVDIQYSSDDDGNIDTNSVDGFSVVKDWAAWAELEVRDCDDFIHTSHGVVRLPAVVICSSFNRVIHKKVSFPTKHNIYKRDNFTCVYTGKKLAKNELSIDHVLPQSRGGGNTWENLVCCDRELNTFKDNRTPSECGLKLLYKPFKPTNGMVFDSIRDEWQEFLGGK